MTTKTFCYFGLRDFDPAYARNRVIISGLRQNNQQVVICRAGQKGFKAVWQLIKEFNGQKSGFKAVIIGYSDSRLPVIIIKLLFRKLVVWDAFYSIHDAYIYDRQLVKPRSFKARYYWLLEWFNCLLADRILLDTDAHIDYFVKTFYVRKNKFIKVLIGADDAVFHL